MVLRRPGLLWLARTCSTAVCPRARRQARSIRRGRAGMQGPLGSCRASTGSARNSARASWPISSPRPPSSQFA